MPRTARKVSKSGVYHVMLRGINRQDIFEDSEDYWTLIKTLAAVAEPHRDYYSGEDVQPCHIYAYCLMPNHVHLLIQEKDWKLAEIVKYIASKYVRHYNQKYGRVGGA